MKQQEKAMEEQKKRNILVTKAKLVGKELEVVGKELDVVGKELEVKRVVMLKARKKRPGKESEKEKLRKKPSWQD